jgi:hypothetical protein
MEETIQSLPKRRGRPKANKYNIVSEYKEKTPSVLIQSGLFNVRQTRIFVKDYCIPAIGDTKIYFTGELFNQFDFDVFQAVIELVHKRKSTEFSFRLFEINEILGRNNETITKETIHKSIHRLSKARFTIDSKRFKFTGGLVDSYTEDKYDSNLHHIRIAQDTLNLFLCSSEYDAELREKMKSNLTKFYYMFLCSHSGAVYDYNLETMHQLSQSESSLKEFKRMSMNSFNELFSITEEKINAQITKGVKGQYKVEIIK